jgi:hypothetical protein
LWEQASGPELQLALELLLAHRWVPWSGLLLVAN